MSQVELQRTHGQCTYHHLKVDHSVFRGSAAVVMNSKGIIYLCDHEPLFTKNQ